MGNFPVGRHPHSTTTTSLTRADISAYVYILYSRALCCQLADIPSSTTTTSLTRADISAYVYVRTTLADIPSSTTTTSLTRADISAYVYTDSRALCCQLPDILAVRPPRHSHLSDIPSSTTTTSLTRADISAYVYTDSRPLCCQLADILASSVVLPVGRHPRSTTTTSLTRADISAYVYTDSRPLFCQLPDILAVRPPRHSHVRTHLPISILIVERCVASCQTSSQYDHHVTHTCGHFLQTSSQRPPVTPRADISAYVYTDSRALCCQLSDIPAVRPPRHSHVRTFLPMSILIVDR
ncbi:hypothetical protein J6590_043121 [Homalodisca vitripennis]|nr:hypothetical protein J6590_043121 [Homalodisca vitripennis]